MGGLNPFCSSLKRNRENGEQNRFATVWGGNPNYQYRENIHFILPTLE